MRNPAPLFRQTIFTFATVCMAMLLTLTSRAKEDPVNVFVDTGGLQTPRSNHTATLLQDGTVLVAGGFNGS